MNTYNHAFTFNTATFYSVLSICLKHPSLRAFPSNGVRQLTSMPRRLSGKERTCLDYRLRRCNAGVGGLEVCPEQVVRQGLVESGSIGIHIGLEELEDGRIGFVPQNVEPCAAFLLSRFEAIRFHHLPQPSSAPSASPTTAAPTNQGDTLVPSAAPDSTSSVQPSSPAMSSAAHQVQPSMPIDGAQSRGECCECAWCEQWTPETGVRRLCDGTSRNSSILSSGIVT